MWQRMNEKKAVLEKQPRLFTSKWLPKLHTSLCQIAIPTHVIKGNSICDLNPQNIIKLQGEKS